MYVGDQLWAEKVAMMVAKHMFISQTRSYERLHLIKLLGQHMFGASRRFKRKGGSHCTSYITYRPVDLGRVSAWSLSSDTNQV